MWWIWPLFNCKVRKILNFRNEHTFLMICTKIKFHLSCTYQYLSQQCTLNLNNWNQTDINYQPEFKFMLYSVIEYFFSLNHWWNGLCQVYTQWYSANQVLSPSSRYGARTLMGKILAMNWTEASLRKIFNKIDKEDTIERILESGRPRSVCTEENIEEVELRICSHEEPGTHEMPNAKWYFGSQWRSGSVLGS